MTLREFHNGLRVLLNIDEWEFVEAGIPREEWAEFRDSPHWWFICTSDANASRLWTIVERRNAK
jgi:hypothetical protein